MIEESEGAIERVQNNNIGGIYFVSASEVINNCGFKIIPIARHFRGDFFNLARQKNVCNLADGSMSNLNNSFDLQVLQTLE